MISKDEARRTAGANSIQNGGLTDMPSPGRTETWKHMLLEEKLEFLHQWCGNISVELKHLESQTEGIFARLQRIEEKIGGTSP